MIKGNIFLTGAGFLARGIMRQAQLENWDCRFTVFSRNEHAQDMCRRKYPGAAYVLGDVRDGERLGLAVMGHDIIVHTAAFKYVDIAEKNVSECLSINIGGTQAVIEAARRSNRVHTVVGISTDKAVEPANVYGLSKAVGERLFYEASQLLGHIRFVQTRYGNVCSSTGSVVPLFKRMAAENNEIRITDPTMTRFWLSIEDAVKLVVYAAEMGSGSILIPDPYAMQLGDLAEAVCPGVPQKIVGLRPGEKMHEKLVTTSESLRMKIDTSVHIGGRETQTFCFHPLYMSTPLLGTFEVTSDQAAVITVDEFRAYVEMAESI